MSKIKAILAGALAAGLFAGVLSVSGCAKSQAKTADGKSIVKIVSYKQEALKEMKLIQDKFNEEHKDGNVYLQIDSPNEAVTIIRTMLIRDNPPDIIAIGGDMTYANFLEADLFVNIQDCQPAVSEVKPVYLQMINDLEIVPKEGVFGLPYFGNAAGMLYNVDMFAEHGWTVPQTYDEFIQLCENIKAAGILPMFAGFKDSWTTLAPWNAIAASLADSDLSLKVNSGTAKFSDQYRRVAEEMAEMLKYIEPNPVAYGYNDACTEFANGKSAMMPIGSYAIPQIRSVNPTMAIGSFTFPAFADPADNKLNSGVDFMFCVMQKPNQDLAAVYEVLNFLYQNDVIDIYQNGNGTPEIPGQGSIPCKEGDFPIPETLKDMSEYISSGRMADYQDHHYPSEMSVDGKLQTFVINTLQEQPGALDAFLADFDSDWVRYNRDNIAKLEKYKAENGG